jgi:hypothetical protein
MANARRQTYATWLCMPCLLFSAAAVATKITDNLEIGGALRARFDSAPDRRIEHAGFDTFMLSAKYTNDNWTATARYRWYGHAYPYTYAHLGSIQFPEYAWIGYSFDRDHQVQVGLNQVPFGVQPLFSSTFYETLGNVIGLEDLWEMGVKYIQQSGDWNLQVGFYKKPVWYGRGVTRGTSYSTIVTPADPGIVDGTNNRERQLMAVRLARKVEVGTWKGEAGVSLLSSSLLNTHTGGSGRRNVFGVHYQGQNGPWGLKLQFARQQMSPDNPAHEQSVTLGGYDGTFNVASRGNLYVGDLSYSLPGEFLNGWVSGIHPYITYSRFQKSAQGFKTSERFFLGTSFSAKSFYIAIEWMNGRNDPYIGGSSYTQSLTYGGIDHWKNQMYMNIGYYF